MIFQRCILAVLIALLLAGSGMAQIKNRKYSLRVELGAFQPTLNDSARQWLLSPQLGFDAQVMLQPRLGIVGSFRYVRFHNDSLNASLLEQDREFANRRWSMITVGVGPKLYLGSRKSLTPYVTAQIAAVIWEIGRHPGGEKVVVEAADGGRTDFRAAEMGLSAELGVERLLADRVALSIAARFAYLTGLGADFAEWVDDTRSRAVMGISGGVAVHFGAPRKNLVEQSTKRERRNRSSRQVYELEDTKPSARQPSMSEVIEDPAGQNYPQIESQAAIADADQDGIADEVDRCPATRAGESVDSLGCPNDYDSDGVVDDLDVCPATPEHLPVDARGCPDRAKIFPRRIYHALFASGSSALRPQSLPAVDSVVTLLRMFQDVRVAVLGYTDAVGSDKANLELSQKRAEALREFFVAAGIESQRIMAVGRGESNPIASNQTRDGRGLNRRIELEFSW